jgi:hypothetical protein
LEVLSQQEIVYAKQRAPRQNINISRIVKLPFLTRREETKRITYKVVGLQIKKKTNLV